MVLGAARRERTARRREGEPHGPLLRVRCGGSVHRRHHPDHGEDAEMSASRVRWHVALATVAAMLAVLAGSSPVAAAPPSNDDIAGATVVGALPYTDGPHDTSEA